MRIAVDTDSGVSFRDNITEDFPPLPMEVHPQSTYGDVRDVLYLPTYPTLHGGEADKARRRSETQRKVLNVTGSFE